ncbi:MAG: T9SS type A sorting domain-containing protein [Ignavibacteriaceae bacterium]
MKEKKFLQPLVILFIVIFPLIIDAQTWKVNSDYWTATDNLGRTTPTESEVGPPKNGKYVGIFYFIWHTDGPATTPLLNTSEILKQHPEAADNFNDPAWGGIYNNAGMFWWDEPLFGYYRTPDDWVLRKHAQMLANAGIDVVFFDNTNGNWTFESGWSELLKVWEQARQQGVKTPQIAFMLNGADLTNSGALGEIKELYNLLYQPGLYKDLWFMWDGKPLILADTLMFSSDSTNQLQNIKDFFTFRSIQGSYVNGPVNTRNLSNVDINGYTAFQISGSNTVGMKFTSDSSFIGIDAYGASYGNNIGDLTLSLYKWKTDYATTVGDTPIAVKTFINFRDNLRLILKFNPQPAGEYYWKLSNGSETVGIWEVKNTKDSVTSYFNGKVWPYGNWDSKIYYPLSTVEKTHYAQWTWIEDYPQHGFGPKDNGSFEEVPVSVAQNASDASGGEGYVFNSPGTYGRSYTKAKGQDSSSDAYIDGLNFQEQWSRAFELDPDLVFVTGWNEWTAGRWAAPATTFTPFAFVDEYNWEKSRDIEPVKSWGDNGDDYYMQLVDNVRRFKGMQVQEAASAPITINLGKLDDWANVKPEFRDYKGDNIWRNFQGQGNNLIYTNNTGRNDIILAKVARDTNYIYFYVETADTLTLKTDREWMRLWIDIDCDKSTGWEGYDYVINRINPEDSAIVEKSVNNSWNWVKVGSAEYAINGNVLELKINRSVFNVEGKKLDFEFKWSDNSENDGNIMDFYINGDAAPDDRFNYVYSDSFSNAAGISEQSILPNDFSLSQNYPNPFNPSTEIKYSVAKSGLVTLKVYNLLGQGVETLINQEQKAGNYIVNFNASKLASGVYMYRIQSGDISITKKMTLLK